jgi:hypothetical protein
MREINLLINFIENIYISPQEYFIIFFTILGIITTVVSIATSLTKEQRQDVIIYYFFKDKFIKFYLIFILISFLLPFCIYLLNPLSKVLQLIVSFLLMVNFLLTFSFIFYVIESLKRRSIYKKMLVEFRGDLE